MKRTLLSLIVMVCLSLSCLAQQGEGFTPHELLAGMKPGDKAALLMVHFGTTYDDTRARTIDAIHARAREAFPSLDVYEAYTSRIIIRKLHQRGVEKHTPLDVLLQLRGLGYTHVVVQSTHLIEGAEMESLRRDVARVAPFFREVRIGTPLLYSVEDSEALVRLLCEHHRVDAASGRKGSDRHFVWVGHGTYTPATALYSQVDYMLKALGYDNVHVGTIEGYPTFDTMLAQLKASKAKRVTLVPLMFVAGDHAHNDIAVEWKERLEQEGFAVTACMEGLGELEGVQALFIEHIRFSLQHRPQDVMSKKQAYADGKETE